jgi:hypothetical protein
MRERIGGGFLVLVLMAAGAAPVLAQTDQGSVSDQFKNGAQSIGQGATSIGEGIKQGAIQTWDAVKAGAQAAGDKFNGDKPSSAPAPADRSAPPSSTPGGETH